MKLNLQDNIKVTTNYNFKVFRHNKLIQEENTHNTLTNNMYIGSIDFASASLYIGKGTGTPSATDSNMFSYLWNIQATSSTVTYHEKTDDSDISWCQCLKKFTIPASTSYVDTITECGLYGRYLISHALLLDAEGNPISIEKTDLDVVIIEVTIRFYLSDTKDVKIIPMHSNMFLRALYNNNGAALTSLVCNNIEVLWSLELAGSGDDLHFWNTQMPPYYYNSHIATSLKGTHNRPMNKARQLDIKGARLGTDWPVKGQHFIKGLRVANTFIIPFPNEKIFPTYEIKNMDVGIGDGSKKEFICPMNYFVADSDKIYIDGVLQVRGVDYVVEHDNNNQGCPELMASNEALISGGLGYNNTNQTYAPIFRAALNAAVVTGYNSYGFYYNNNYANYPYYFDKDNPLFIDMKKPTKVNYLQIGANANYSGSYGGVKITLWSSDDGEAYEEVTSVTRTTSAGVHKIKFDTITKQYFKVTVKYNSSDSNVSSGHTSGTFMSQSCSYYQLQSAIDPDTLWLLGYIGQGIVFTNPPAEGAVITMDASTDLPMKNENFVFDVDLTMTF